MLFYCILWLIISMLAIPFNMGKIKNIINATVLFMLIVIIGLRFEVGVDWYNYLRKLNEYNYVYDLDGFLSISEPGYGFLNYISLKMGLTDNILVNFVSSTLFFICFFSFTKKFKNFIFPLFVCFTYTIIVVNMNYTRQATAIGFSLLTFLSIVERKIISALVFIFLGALFHKSILVISLFLPFALKSFNFRNSFLFFSYLIFSLTTMTGLIYYSELTEISNYTNADSSMTSGGVYMRLMMHIFPVFLYIYYRRSYRDNLPNIILFDFLVYLILYLFVLAINYSTLADRLNLYLVFFDIFVVTYIFNNRPVNEKMLIWLGVFICNTIVFLLWLLYGKWTSIAWIPYGNYIFNFLEMIF